MTVREVPSKVDRDALLTGAEFADAFCIEVADTGINARRAAERMVNRQPRWVETLMSLRNFLVTPLGLKTSGAGAGTRDMIGMFPVVSDTPDRRVAGFNDRHLDFRLVVDVTTSGEAKLVTATTLVRTNNRLGRIYLAIIMPFHRLIVPAMLRRVAA